MKKDPFHEGCLPIHISCLIELRKPNGKSEILALIGLLLQLPKTLLL